MTKLVHNLFWASVSEPTGHVPSTQSPLKKRDRHVWASWNCLMTYFIIPCFHRVSIKTSLCDCFAVLIFAKMRTEMNIWRKLNDVHQTWFGLVTRKVIIILINTYCVKVFLTDSNGLSNQLHGLFPVNLLTLYNPQTLPRDVGIHDVLQSRHAEGRMKEGGFGLLRWMQ